MDKNISAAMEKTKPEGEVRPERAKTMRIKGSILL